MFIFLLALFQLISQQLTYCKNQFSISAKHTNLVPTEQKLPLNKYHLNIFRSYAMDSSILVLPLS